MEIKLFIDGKEKTFTVPFVKARMLRRAIEASKKFDQKNIDENALDTMIDFVVELFNEQFTRDQVYDGMDARELIPTITRLINQVTNPEGKEVPNK